MQGEGGMVGGTGPVGRDGGEVERRCVCGWVSGGGAASPSEGVYGDVDGCLSHPVDDALGPLPPPPPPPPRASAPAASDGNTQTAPRFAPQRCAHMRACSTTHNTAHALARRHLAARDFEDALGDVDGRVVGVASARRRPQHNELVHA